MVSECLIPTRKIPGPNTAALRFSLPRTSYSLYITLSGDGVFCKERTLIGGRHCTDTSDGPLEESLSTRSPRSALGKFFLGKCFKSCTLISTICLHSLKEII